MTDHERAVMRQLVEALGNCVAVMDQKMRPDQYGNLSNKELGKMLFGVHMAGLQALAAAKEIGE